MTAAHKENLVCVGVVETDRRTGLPDFSLEKERGRTVHPQAPKNLKILDEYCFVPFEMQEHTIPAMLAEIGRLMSASPTLNATLGEYRSETEAAERDQLDQLDIDIDQLDQLRSGGAAVGLDQPEPEAGLAPGSQPKAFLNLSFAGRFDGRFLQQHAIADIKAHVAKALLTELEDIEIEPIQQAVPTAADDSDRRLTISIRIPDDELYDEWIAMNDSGGPDDERPWLKEQVAQVMMHSLTGPNSIEVDIRAGSVCVYISQLPAWAASLLSSVFETDEPTIGQLRHTLSTHGAIIEPAKPTITVGWLGPHGPRHAWVRVAPVPCPVVPSGASQPAARPANRVFFPPIAMGGTTAVAIAFLETQLAFTTDGEEETTFNDNAIPGIGDAGKAALEDEGISNAAQVTLRSIHNTRRAHILQQERQRLKLYETLRRGHPQAPFKAATVQPTCSGCANW
jgi:hypothetical protein